jgi:hypothetical protein
MPHCIKELHWTSRREVCDRLFAFIRETGPEVSTSGRVMPDEQYWLRQTALDLLSTLSDGSNAADLLHLLRGSGSDGLQQV